MIQSLFSCFSYRRSCWGAVRSSCRYQPSAGLLRAWMRQGDEPGPQSPVGISRGQGWRPVTDMSKTAIQETATNSMGPRSIPRGRAGNQHSYNVAWHSWGPWTELEWGSWGSGLGVGRPGRARRVTGLVPVLTLWENQTQRTDTHFELRSEAGMAGLTPLPTGNWNSWCSFLCLGQHFHRPLLHLSHRWWPFPAI